MKFYQVRRHFERKTYAVDLGDDFAFFVTNKNALRQHAYMFNADRDEELRIWRDTYFNDNFYELMERTNGTN
jgi:hypothetical protein